MRPVSALAHGKGRSRSSSRCVSVATTCVAQVMPRSALRAATMPRSTAPLRWKVTIGLSFGVTVIHGLAYVKPVGSLASTAASNVVAPAGATAT